ncbi:MAG: GNAT family N-acetyltransferase [Desulfuromonadales bacterium]
MNLEIENNRTGNRFEAEVAGSVAFVEYALDDNILTLVHTEVPANLEGQGLGGKIVKAALDFAKDQGLKVVLQCPFARSYIERHQEYAGIVAQ